jgi:GxxExxY protein
MKVNDLTKIIIDCAVEVHRTLGGPGLLESVYEEALVWELKNRQLSVLKQVYLPIHYKGCSLGTTLRIDIMVNKMVIVECKAVDQMDTIFRSQLLTYLRLSGLRVGLLLKFGRTLMKDGIQRVINGF